MHDPQVVAVRQLDDLLQELEVAHMRRRVGREADDDTFGFRAGLLRQSFLDSLQELLGAVQRNVDHLPARDDHGPLVDGVAGVGHQHGIPLDRVDDREHEMRETFLGPDHGDRLGGRIDPHVVLLGVPVAHREPETLDPQRLRVAVVLGVAGGLDQLLDDVRRGLVIGIAHPEIDDVFAPGACLIAQLGDFRENIRR